MASTNTIPRHHGYKSEGNEPRTGRRVPPNDRTYQDSPEDDRIADRCDANEVDDRDTLNTLIGEDAFERALRERA